MKSPFHALAERALAESKPDAPVHYAELLDRGEDALLLRIHLVRAARRSIDVQTYIFEEDDAGFLMLDELVKAARRGVKVRVIVDQLFSLDDIELLAQLARAHVNFELRVYNPTFHKASTPPLEFAMGILCCFKEFNQRMHNKLLLIDGDIGIAGGRNYQNRYFDWDDDFDYRDRDVLVAGPAGAAMQASFDAFWAQRKQRAAEPLARRVASHPRRRARRTGVRDAHVQKCGARRIVVASCRRYERTSMRTSRRRRCVSARSNTFPTRRTKRQLANRKARR